MKFKKVIFCFVLLAFTLVNAAPVSIQNGSQFYDTSGNLLHAHGGGVLKVGSYYYWFGENRNSNDTFYAVSCYRSTDLKNWEFRNNVLQQSSASELNSCKIERPKVIYCASTGKYVMWMHKENATDYNEARAAVATCSTVDGNYTYLGSFRPLNNMSRDCTLYVDSDGSAYFVSAANDNADLHVYRLSSDYQTVSSLVQKLWVGQSREAPCMFKRNGYYFLITSGCTGWTPNQQKYGYTTSISGTWSSLINIGDSTCSNSQGTYVQPIQGSQTTSYLFMADRWAGAWGRPVNESSYVWFPLQFSSDTAMTINWYNNITIDTATGSVTGGAAPTPTPDPSNLALNKTATADSEETAKGNTAHKGNDGNLSTRWCANDGNLNHWWKVDLGASYNMTGTEVTWEYGGRVYKYKVEVSANNSTWTLKVDKTNNTSTQQTQRDNFTASGIRYVRITVTGLPADTWASFFEFKVFGSSGATPTPTPTPAATPTPFYSYDFSAGIGGYSQVAGTGTWAVESGELSGTATTSGETVCVDNNSPSVANAIMKFSINPVSGQRFGGVFRYASSSSYAMIYFDNGNIGWQNASSWGNLVSGVTISAGSIHTFEINYQGSQIIVKVDGVEKYNGSVTQFPTGAGKIGFRCWALSHNHFDNVTLR